MNNETLKRLYSRHANSQNHVTPNQIQKFLGAQENPPITDEAGFDGIPENLVSFFETVNGKPKKGKIERFKNSVDLLRAQFTDEEILKINSGCIFKSGAVDEERFRIILSKK